jgi:hypothetical protein
MRGIAAARRNPRLPGRAPPGRWSPKLTGRSSASKPDLGKADYLPTRSSKLSKPAATRRGRQPLPRFTSRLSSHTNALVFDCSAGGQEAQPYLISATLRFHADSLSLSSTSVNSASTIPITTLPYLALSCSASPGRLRRARSTNLVAAPGLPLTTPSASIGRTTSHRDRITDQLCQATVMGGPPCDDHQVACWGEVISRGHALLEIRPPPCFFSLLLCRPCCRLSSGWSEDSIDPCSRAAPESFGSFPYLCTSWDRTSRTALHRTAKPAVQHVIE